MRRREFITLLGGAAVAWPIVSHAQRATARTLGFLGVSTPSAQKEWTAAFVQRLHELGWIEGRNIAIEYRWAEGRNERFAQFAAEFVRLKIDAIVTAEPPRPSPQNARHRSFRSCSRQATRSPLAWSREACRDRVAMSPFVQTRRTTLPPSEWKCCARCSRVSAAWRSWPISAARLRSFRWAKHRQRLARWGLRSRLSKSNAPRTSCRARGYAEIRSTQAVNEPLAFNHRDRIAASALRAQIPTMNDIREHVEAGGLMSYGPNFPDLYRRAAHHIDKILRGQARATSQWSSRPNSIWLSI